MQILHALDEFLLQLDADGRSEHTRKQYRRHVRLLARWLATGARSGEIADVTHQDLAAFLASPEARTRPDGTPKKATSTNSLRTSLRCFFSYLHRAGHLREDPARLTRRAICSPPPPRALSDDEQTRLLAALDAAKDEKEHRDAALFRLMLATGIRVGSAVALDIDDVDVDRAEIRLRTMKGGREDRVLLSSAACDDLRSWIGGRTAGPLFRGHGGRRITTRHARRRFTMWCRRVEIRHPTGPHGLRHTFAQRLYDRTADVLLVRAALRHKSIESSMVYVRTPLSRMRRALEN